MDDAAQIQLDQAIRLDRNARVSRRDLERIHQAIRGNSCGEAAITLAISVLAGFLRYANEVLVRAEKRKRSYYDEALAVIKFAALEFSFTREEG